MLWDSSRMVYPPKAIANFFLDKAKTEGKKLTPLQVIKLVFIAHGWHLGLTGNKLVSETPQAWQYGPVFPSLYKEFRRFGDEPIRGYAKEVVGYSTERIVAPPSRIDDVKLCKLLDQVWDEYGKFSGTQLSTLTHQRDSPWEITWTELDAKDEKEVEIPEFLIKDYYAKLRLDNAGPRSN